MARKHRLTMKKRKTPARNPKLKKGKKGTSKRTQSKRKGMKGGRVSFPETYFGGNLGYSPFEGRNINYNILQDGGEFKNQPGGNLVTTV